MEGFNEQVVKRDKTLKSLVIKILAVALLIIVPLMFVLIAKLTTIFYLIMVGFFVFLGGIYVVWYVFSTQKVEYEYSVAGDTLEISKVIALRKRKRICRLEIKNIESLEVGDGNIKDKHFRKVYFAAKNINDTKTNYYAVFTEPIYGKCLLVFNPNEQILQGLKPYLKKELMLKLFYHK